MQPTQEQLEVIQRVIQRIAPKYKFAYFETDDIEQESYLICLEALENYDPSRPLENFIAKHLSNRLKTLRRNKYYRQNIPEDNKSHTKLNENKKNLMDLRSFNSIKEDSPDFLSLMYYHDDFNDNLSSSEAVEKVLGELTPEMRNDFLRAANGVSITHYRKRALFDKVKEILGENW